MVLLGAWEHSQNRIESNQMILIIIPSCHLVLCCEKPQWHQEYMYFPQFCRNVGNQKIPNLVNWYCFANCHQNLRTTEGRTSRSLFLWPCFRRNNTITIHRALKIRKKVEFSKLTYFSPKLKSMYIGTFFLFLVHCVPCTTTILAINLQKRFVIWGRKYWLSQL